MFIFNGIKNKDLEFNMKNIFSNDELKICYFQDK